MIDLWAAYNNERWGVKTLIEKDKGFISYTLNPPVAIIQDIYIAPEHRESGLALSLTDMVSALAVRANCTEMQTQVWVGANGSERSLELQLRYGFKLISADAGRIMLVKSLKG